MKEDPPKNPSVKENIVTVLEMLEERLRTVDETVQFPVQIGKNALEASFFGKEGGKTQFGLFLGEQKYSRKTLEVSEDGTVEEDTTGVLPDFDKTEHEPDFSDVTNDQIALIVLSKLVNQLGLKSGE